MALQGSSSPDGFINPSLWMALVIPTHAVQVPSCTGGSVQRGGKLARRMFIIHDVKMVPKTLEKFCGIQNFTTVKRGLLICTRLETAKLQAFA